MELPQDFKERMERQLGDAYGDFLASYEKGRVYGLRYNPLKIEKDRLLALLSEYPVALEQVAWSKEGFYYPADAHPGKLALHEAGAYYIQEPSAMLAVELLDPKPGEKILDLCAAPGGKSTQIAARMQGEGLFVSNEAIAKRAKTLSRNIERMGIKHAVVLNETPKRLAGRFPLFFDRILVDAPCSGEGMFRKNPQACGEWSLQRVESCAQRQRDILAQASGMLKPGGILVYATCTFAPQENDGMAEWFVQEYPEFMLEKREQIWPHLQRGEGHYAARFLKRGQRLQGQAVQEEVSQGRFVREEVLQERAVHRNALQGRVMQKKAARKEGITSSGQAGTGMNVQKFLPGGREFSDFLEQAFSEGFQKELATRIQAGQLVAFGGQLCVLPPGIGSLDGLKTERAGLQLGRWKKNRFEPSHALAMALRPQDVKQVLELPEPERYVRGETVRCGMQKGWTLVTVGGCSLGWGKASQGVLKNHYPKGLR